LTISKTLLSDDAKFKAFKDQSHELFQRLEEEQGQREVMKQSLMIVS
jgi:hypothetical protein